MDSNYTAAQTMVADDNSAHPSSDVEMTAPDVEYSPPVPCESPEPELHVHEPDRRARVEECEDENERWAGRYPSPAGETIGEGTTIFEGWHTDQKNEDRSAWYPFSSQDEWELAQWLMKSVGQTSIDEYLKLPIVSERKLLKGNTNSQ